MIRRGVTIGVVLLVVVGRGGAAAAEAPAPRSSADGAPIIELFTMGPGALFVEKFGHAAMCVRWPRGAIDPETERPRRDTCYNYGTTNFKAPLSLGWGFLRGNAAFWVEKWPRARMIRHYIAKDRSIYVQTFDAGNMAPARRQQMADKLEWDARAENRYYRYHHFHDNCTTRVRDILNDAVGGKLREVTGARPGPTFREYGRMGFAEDEWLLVMSDFAMGPPGDEQPDGWQVMFLPRYLRAAVEEKLGVPARVVYERRGPAFPQSGSSGGGWTLLIGFAIALPAIVTRALRRRQRLGLGISAGLLGFIGLLLWFVAVASTLPELRWNLALLIFVPFDFALPFLAAARRRRYAQLRLCTLLVLAVVLAVGIFSQPLWFAILFALPTLGVAALPSR